MSHTPARAPSQPGVRRALARWTGATAAVLGLVLLGVLPAVGSQAAEPRLTSGAAAVTGSGVPRPLRWLAAGDSYSSGQGTFLAAGQCQRSPTSWPVVAESTAAFSAEFIQTFRACTGAQTGEFFAYQGQPGHKYGGPLEWDPGLGKFDLVTFSLGGNDVGFAPFLERCLGTSLLLDGYPPSWTAVYHSVLPTNCGNEAAEKATVDQNIGGGTYARFLDRVASSSVQPGGNLVVVGYPELVADPSRWPPWVSISNNCWGLNAFDAGEFRRLATYLNNQLADEVDQANRDSPNRVHISFVNIDTGDSFHVSTTDPRLYDPSTGADHNACSADERWVNGVTLLPDYLGSFHPDEAGNAATAALVAPILSHDLNWSGLGPPVTAGQTGWPKVPVPDGWESVITDDRGGIFFWKYTDATGTMTGVGSSRYPVLPGPNSVVPVRVTGRTLPGMADATFIVSGGAFTGDGTGNAIAYGAGPNGWGVLAPNATETLLVPSGHPATDNSTPGLKFQERFTDGGIQTQGTSGTDPQEGPDGEGLPVLNTYAWDGRQLNRSASNIFTATAAPTPNPAPPSVGDPPGTPPLTLSRQLLGCPTVLGDGTYEGVFNTTMHLAQDGSGPAGGTATVQTTGGAAFYNGYSAPCTFDIGPSVTASIPIIDPASGRVHYISAPGWMVGNVQDDGLADRPSSILVNLAGRLTGSSTTNRADYVAFGAGYGVYGNSPYYIPPALGGVFAQLETVGVPGLVVQFTVRSGQLTHVTVYAGNGRDD